jgi:hypothetical protein
MRAEIDTEKHYAIPILLSKHCADFDGDLAVLTDWLFDVLERAGRTDHCFAIDEAKLRRLVGLLMYARRKAHGEKPSSARRLSHRHSRNARFDG